MEWDVAVLGSGPAGFYCALSCAGRGKRTVLVERDRLGGTGFRWGCLPVKMMLDRLRRLPPEARSMPGGSGEPASLITDTARRIRKIESRMRRRLTAAGVEVISGEGSLADPNTVRLDRGSTTAAHIVIATGSEAAGWPGVPLNGESFISHREVLGLTEIPEHLLILGGDVEGLEFACLFARLGCRVTVIEKERRILPGTDRDLADAVERELLARGVALRTGIGVLGCSDTGEPAVSLSDGSETAADKVLLTGVRRANVPEGLERIGVEQDGQHIPVNADLETDCSTVYAVGDVNGITGMAHAAIQQGLLAARRIVGPKRSPGGTAAPPPYPRAIYTLPEIAGAGYQESELDALGTAYRRVSFSLADTWRGFAKGIDRGFMKVLAGEEDRILGLWICGADASEQASLFGPLLAGGLTVAGLRNGLILHPTLGESALEAIMELE